MGTIINGVAILNLTEASEETLKGIKAIKNVGIMVYNEKFEPFMSKISFRDIATSMKVTGKFTLINGKLVLDKNYVTNMKEPMSFLINGKVVVKPGVTAEMIDEAIHELVVNGKILCSESTQAALQQKINQNNGKMAAYMDDAVLQIGKTTINNAYLKQLGPKTNLAVDGEALMTDDLDLALVDEKLNRIQFLQEAVISEANQEPLSQKLVDHAGITIVPDGYTYIGGDLQLDAEDITRFEQAKLLVKGSVYLDESVSQEAVQNHISDIKTEEAIYCRSELKSAILQKCEPSVKVIAYSGTLRMVDGEHTLTQPELDYTEGKITFIVHGILKVDKKVDPKALFEKVEKIDLYGIASGNTEQCGVLQTKMRIKQGLVENEDEKNNDQEKPLENVDPDDTYISNVSQLKL